MKVPDNVCSTRLWVKLSEDPELATKLEGMRQVIYALAQTTSRTVPDFTDHTIRHMDALWVVSDHVLKPEETEKLSPAEAFLLGCGFYLHDIGMAYAATEDGLRAIRNSPPYKSFIAAARLRGRVSGEDESLAIGFAVRRLHADAARTLAVDEIPGAAGIYIFESKIFRDAWAETCGVLAASHHWDISMLEEKFGRLAETPLPGNRQGDLLYVAGCLRLIDYAHINRERASTIDRAFRPRLNDESAMHWSAQENIDGPTRSDNYLVYKAAKSISDVDAWWLFYQMMNGLSSEIRSVSHLLNYRKEGLKRLSLMGVMGADSPKEATNYIPTSGFLPIEVNLRAGSIDRLVELLAGETLYGPNPMAAVRELIQNARDAVLLKRMVATDPADIATANLPIELSLNTKSESPTLEIIDHGIGMSKRVMTDFLISIASSYWSTQFANDFPTLAERGFNNAGRFGIGFLSVFMLGQDVMVESNRAGDQRHRLSLRGVGRRGEISSLHSASGSGTKIRISLKDSAIKSITPLQELVQYYAPTLPHAIKISVDGESVELTHRWLHQMSPSEFHSWTLRAASILQRTQFPPVSSGAKHRGLSPFERMRSDKELDIGQYWPSFIPEYISGSDRLVASPEGVSLLCLRGLAVESVRTPGFVGVIDLDAASPDVSRSRVVGADLSQALTRARDAVALQVIENLDTLGNDHLLIQKVSFLKSCASLYGDAVIENSRIPWVHQLKLPGNIEMIPSTSVLNEVAASRSVFVNYNSGPWTALKRWAALGATQSQIALLVSGEGQATPRYRTSAESTLTGSLQELWPQWHTSPLFKLLISLIAQSWQMNPVELAEQKNWVHEGSEVYGTATRG